jgi:hypothetical protein
MTLSHERELRSAEVARSSLRKDLANVFGGVSGWRLEARTTPGATPLWCFVAEGQVELSVTVDDPAIVLYVMDTDEEVRFTDREGLAVWLAEHRPEAWRQAPPREGAKKRARRFLEWS